MVRGQRGLQGLWLKGLVFVLLGYILLGKTFAYFFFGELLLVAGFGVLLLSRRVLLVFNDSVLLLWACFAFWGFCRTVPFISKYHFDAIRDAVLWGYGVFALLVVAFVNHSHQISRALNSYRKFLRWYLPVAPFLLVASLMLGGALPRLPWAHSVSILQLKAGDCAVDIAAAGLFLLMFPDRRTGLQKEGVSVYRLAGLIGWCLTALVVMAVNRGGTVAIVLSMALASMLRLGRVLGKVASISIIAASIGVVTLFAIPLNIKIGGRVVDPDKLVATLSSIAGGSGKGTAHENTAKWRLMWWSNIVHETFYGPYFWKGRGFGVNLAVADGPLGSASSEEEVALRSPHNGSMSVLARMGVPGLALWIALNVVFAFRLFRAQRLASRQGSRFWSGVFLWVLASWLATLVNLSFDVYLEGPQGGIWFWSIIGFGVAAMRVHAYELRQLISLSRAPVPDEAEPDNSLVPAL
jgi:hypothetical protein